MADYDLSRGILTVELQTVLCLLSEHQLWDGSGCAGLQYVWSHVRDEPYDDARMRELVIRQYPRLAEAEPSAELLTMGSSPAKYGAVTRWAEQVAAHAGLEPNVTVTIPPSAPHDGEAAR